MYPFTPAVFFHLTDIPADVLFTADIVTDPVGPTCNVYDFFNAGLYVGYMVTVAIPFLRNFSSGCPVSDSAISIMPGSDDL